MGDVRNLDVENLRPFGYWRSGRELALPHPAEFVDTGWDEQERERVVAYLCQCYRLVKYMGYSWCRFDCGVKGIEMGSCDMTDGSWRFPEGLVHYVVHHAVKPSGEFLDHIRGNDLLVPEVPALEGKAGVAFLRGLRPGMDGYRRFMARRDAEA